MLDMQMPSQEYQLAADRLPGVYTSKAAALVMVGHWGLDFTSHRRAASRSAFSSSIAPALNPIRRSGRRSDECRTIARSSPSLATSVAAVAGCGSGGGSTGPIVQPARTFGLTDFKPAGPVLPGRRTVVSFKIRTPSGKTLTRYKECCDPHAGVDLIVVRSDDSHVQYIDADAEADGEVSVPVVFPTAGRYRIIVDAYPQATGPSTPFNFQLFKWVTVRGRYHAAAASSYRSAAVVDGYRFAVAGPPAPESDRAGLPRVPRHRPGADRRPTSQTGAGRSRTRSSSARATSPTRTPTSAIRGTGTASRRSATSA